MRRRSHEFSAMREYIPGQAREIYTGSGANKWTNQQGTVIDSTLSPGQDFHQLQVLPRP
jgi:hypothetical protein